MSRGPRSQMNEDTFAPCTMSEESCHEAHRMRCSFSISRRSRQTRATVTVTELTRYRAGTRRFSYETDKIRGHVTFAEGAGTGDLSVGGLDLYQWDSGPPYFGGKPRLQWEEEKGGA